MPQYLHPGVYVEEVPSAVRPIAGVGTSTAGFIGVVAAADAIPLRTVTGETVGTGDGKATSFDLDCYPVLAPGTPITVKVAGANAQATLANDDKNRVSRVTFDKNNVPA